jgi:hypothetical protein
VFFGDRRFGGKYSIAANAGFFLGLILDHENRGDMLLRNVELSPKRVELQSLHQHTCKTSITLLRCYESDLSQGSGEGSLGRRSPCSYHPYVATLIKTKWNRGRDLGGKQSKAWPSYDARREGGNNVTCVKTKNKWRTDGRSDNRNTEVVSAAVTPQVCIPGSDLECSNKYPDGGSLSCCRNLQHQVSKQNFH